MKNYREKHWEIRTNNAGYSGVKPEMNLAK